MVLGLWVVAFGLTIWILGPVVAFFLGGRRIDVDVHPETLIARPYPEDADGLRRYEQLLALGFHPVGWTSEHARFLTPIHWHWRSLQGARWLASPDKRTFVGIYRLVANEPARLAAVTLLEGKGSWSTHYPGMGLKTEPIGNQGRAEVRGVDPAEFLRRHAEYVETFRRERGLGVKPGTLAEVANSSLTYTRAYLAKQGGAAFVALPLGIFALPAAFSFARFGHGSERAQLVGAAGVIFMALFYAVFRYGLLALTKGHSARRAHTRAFELEQTAVAPDGTIVPGVYERWVRVIAALGAADMIARLVLLGVKARAVIALGSGTSFMAAMMALLCVLALRDLARRTSGRAGRRVGNARSRGEPWYSWGVIALLMTALSKNGQAPSRLIWLGGAVGCALLGWWLEKNGRK